MIFECNSYCHNFSKSDSSEALSQSGTRKALLINLSLAADMLKELSDALAQEIGSEERDQIYFSAASLEKLKKKFSQ